MLEETGNRNNSSAEGATSGGLNAGFLRASRHSIGAKNSLTIGADYDFNNQDLVAVIKILARAMQRNVYIGPGVEGRAITLRHVTPDAALAIILKKQKNDIASKWWATTHSS